MSLVRFLWRSKSLRDFASAAPKDRASHDASSLRSDTRHLPTSLRSVGPSLYPALGTFLLPEPSCRWFDSYGAKPAARSSLGCAEESCFARCVLASLGYKESSHLAMLGGVAPAGLVDSALNTCHRHVAPPPYTLPWALFLLLSLTTGGFFLLLNC